VALRRGDECWVVQTMAPDVDVVLDKRRRVKSRRRERASCGWSWFFPWQFGVKCVLCIIPTVMFIAM
jgi:hypothetical protein